MVQIKGGTSDLSTWTLIKVVLFPRDFNSNLPQDADMTTYYTKWAAGNDIQVEDFTSIGVLISYLSRRLAWENSALRDLADYYRDIKITGDGSGISRNWQPNVIYSPEVFSNFGIRGPLTGEANTWNEWCSIFW